MPIESPEIIHYEFLYYLLGIKTLLVHVRKVSYHTASAVCACQNEYTIIGDT